MSTYTDGTHEYFVSNGISRGKSWLTVRRKHGRTGTHRVKTKFLPVVGDKETAQADLDAWAEKKRLVKT